MVSLASLHGGEKFIVMLYVPGSMQVTANALHSPSTLPAQSPSASNLIAMSSEVTLLRDRVQVVGHSLFKSCAMPIAQV